MSDNRSRTPRDSEQKDKLVERLVAINRVTKVTKGGRTFTFAAIVVVGDEEGRIGFGLGKAGEVSAAIQKGGAAARRNLKQIPLHKGTIPHEQVASYGGARVFLKPASAGTGVKAGGAMRAVLESDRSIDSDALSSDGSSSAWCLCRKGLQGLIIITRFDKYNGTD